MGVGGHTPYFAGEGRGHSTILIRTLNRIPALKLRKIGRILTGDETVD